MDKKDLVTIRDSEPGDHNFVLATFLRGLYYGDSWFTMIPKSIFMDQYHAILEILINSPGVDIKVCCLKDDPEVILGYSIYSNTVLHFVYVKRSWRAIGIAKSLVPINISATTHLTDVGRKLLRDHPSVVFNPFLC